MALVPRCYKQAYKFHCTQFITKHSYSSQRSINYAEQLPYYLSNRVSNIDKWSISNRDGLIQFAVSENTLSTNLLLDKLNSIQSNFKITEQTLYYSPCKYYQPLQQSITNFIHKHIATQYKLNPDHIIIASGCGAIWSPLFSAITDPNDIILLPTPYFAGFQADMKSLNTDVQTMGLPTTPDDDYN